MMSAVRKDSGREILLEVIRCKCIVSGLQNNELKLGGKKKKITSKNTSTLKIRFVYFSILIASQTIASDVTMLVCRIFFFFYSHFWRFQLQSRHNQVGRFNRD